LWILIGILLESFVYSYKVERSVNLLNSLSSERVRWEHSNETFSNQMRTIIGDCILSSAFVSYAGYYDQIIRKNLFSQWSKRLVDSNIPIRKDMSQNEVWLVYSFLFLHLKNSIPYFDMPS
jgi:hypothetical protein